MKTVTSITGREFKISANKSKRTFTIRTFGSKYRTYPMDKQEFETAWYWTGNDWSQFMKSHDYYCVK
jgi:phage-related protein